MKYKAPLVSIALLTRNSSKTIKGVLDGIAEQHFKDYEIILIDSSSTDDTLKIARNYPCKITSIKPAEFGHGKTRNYAAHLAKGQFIVFLTHDSVPRTNVWLSEMLKPFEDKRVVGVYGRQVPRDDENILDKCFQASLYGDKDIIWSRDNWKQGDNIFSDANSALRRTMLLKYPYPSDIIVSEDYEWAAKMLQRGSLIAYSATAQVTHSHSYNLKTLFKRNFDVGVSYKTIYSKRTKNGFATKGLSILKAEISQLYRMGYSLLIPLAVVRDAVRFIAIQLGKHEELFSVGVKRNYLSAQGWYWK